VSAALSPTGAGVYSGSLALAPGAWLVMCAAADSSGVTIYAGQKTVDTSTQAGLTMVSEMGLQDFDVIGFDPRGVDRSNGLRCLTDAEVDATVYLDSSPDTPEEQAAIDAADSQFDEACLAAYGDTLIQYDPPIQALAYPLVDGDSFSSEPAGSGTFQGNAFYSSTDTYESTVTGRGTVKTPAGDFPAFRVQTLQLVEVPILVFPFVFSVERRQVIFVTACTGVVASITSEAAATDFAFERAQRVRRVGLPQ
jgi:hypothetical protein